MTEQNDDSPSPASEEIVEVAGYADLAFQFLLARTTKTGMLPTVEDAEEIAYHVPGVVDAVFKGIARRASTIQADSEG